MTYPNEGNTKEKSLAINFSLLLFEITHKLSERRER
jgi:hypothetical protein